MPSKKSSGNKGAAKAPPKGKAASGEGDGGGLQAYANADPELTAAGGGGRRGGGGRKAAAAAAAVAPVVVQPRMVLSIVRPEELILVDSPAAGGRRGNSNDDSGRSHSQTPQAKKARPQRSNERSKSLGFKNFVLRQIVELFDETKAYKRGEEEQEESEVLNEAVAWQQYPVHFIEGVGSLVSRFSPFSQSGVDSHEAEDERLLEQMERTRELLAERETSERFNTNLIWNKIGFIEKIFGKHVLIEESYNVLRDLVENKTDASGASVIHLAYLYKNYEVGRWLVKQFPEAALLGYSDTTRFKLKSSSGTSGVPDMPYAGENLLHMCIVRRNLAEVRWLLNFFRDAPAPDNVIKAMNHFSTEIEDLKYAKNELIEGGGTQDTASFKQALANFEFAKATLASLSPEDGLEFSDAQRGVTAAELHLKSVARKEYMAAKMATKEYKERNAAREKWLGNMLSAKVTGTFFSKKGKFYFAKRLFTSPWLQTTKTCSTSCLATTARTRPMRFLFPPKMATTSFTCAFGTNCTTCTKASRRIRSLPTL